MAGKKQKRPALKTAGRRLMARRTSRSTITTNRPPSAIVRATRSLIGLLPFGKDIIRPLADFVFRGFGLTTGSANLANFYMTGCVNHIYLSPIITWSTSDYCIRNEDHDIPVGGQIQTCVRSVKMNQLTVKLRNESKLGNRQGRWAAAIVPFKTQKEKEDLEHLKGKYFSYKDVCSFPFARFGSSDSPITIGYIFKNPNELCSREMSVDTEYCAVMIAFEDLARQNMSAITTDEFAINISVSTVFQIKSFTANRTSERYGYDIHSLFEGQKEITVYQSDIRKSKFLQYNSFENKPADGYVKMALATRYSDPDPPEDDFQMLNLVENRD